MTKRPRFQWIKNIFAGCRQRLISSERSAVLCNTAKPFVWTNIKYCVIMCSFICRGHWVILFAITKFVLQLMKHICWLYISIDQHVHTINHVKDSCVTLIYRHIWQNLLSYMFQYIKVPHESLTWFMVWTCWSYQYIITRCVS